MIFFVFSLFSLLDLFFLSCFFSYKCRIGFLFIRFFFLSFCLYMYNRDLDFPFSLGICMIVLFASFGTH